MNTISAIGKWLDQPILVKEFSRAVPTILVGGGAIYTYNHVKNTPRENKKKELIKSVIVLSTTIFAALIAPKASSKIIKRFSKESSCGHCSCGHEHGHGAATGLKELKEEMKQKVEDFLKSNKDLKDNPELKKIKEGGILNISGIKKLFKKMEARPGGKEFLSGEDGLIPNPENIDSKHIFDEITRISVLGLFPVLGGIAGGIAGDRMTEKNWKDKIPNKIKEGSFQ